MNRELGAGRSIRRTLTGLGVAFLGASLVPLTLMAVPAGATTTTAPSCSNQHNLHNPTGSPNQVLDSYWFSISHGGTTISVCTLFGNVDPGDVVTAHVVTHDDAAVEVTLASYSDNPGDPHHQTLFQCQSFNTVRDTVADDPCASQPDEALTVTVPACGFQIDLIYGEPLKELVQGQYAQQDVWINGQAGAAGTACPGSPTPTPTATPGGPTPTPTPSGATQAAVTTPGTGADPALTATIGSLLLMATGGSAIFAARKVGRNKSK